MKLRAILRRSIVFSLLAVLVVTLWTTAAIADTPSPNVGQAAMTLWDGLRIGAYGIVGLAVLEVVELGMLALADRDGSKLKPAIPYLSVAAAVTATAAAALVASGEKAGLMAALTALFTALVAHYKTPTARTASETPAEVKAQGGFASRWMLLCTLVAAVAAGSIMAATACGPTGKRIAADAKACATEVAKGLPSSLEQDVIGWLTDTALSDADIKAKLEALASGAAQTGLAGGEQAIVCIVQSAVADLEKSLTGQLGTGSAASSPDALGVARGKAWLTSHQVK